MALDNSYQSRKICVFRNGDVFYPGKKIVVSLRVFRNWEQFLHTVGDQVTLTAGAIRKIYDIQGKRINHLDDIEDGGDYVASGGEPFRKVNYPQSLNSIRQTPLPPGTTRRQALLKTREGDTGERRSEKSAAGKSVFGPSTKAYRVHLFVNGDSANPGVRFLLNARNCRTFEQLLMEISKPLQLHTTTPARRLYDGNTAKRITKLEDLRDGQWIVATMGHEPFKHAAYYEADESVTVHKKKEEPLKVVTFFPNGDAYHTGVKVTVNSFKFPDIEKLISSLDHQVPLITGRIKRICTLSGQRIETPDQLEHRKSYVVVAGNEPFQKIRYNINAPETPSRISSRESTTPLQVKSRDLHSRQFKSEKNGPRLSSAADNTSIPKSEAMGTPSKKKVVTTIKKQPPAKITKSSKTLTKQRPSILPEEREDEEEDHPTEKDPYFAPGAGPQNATPSTREEAREQRALANEFQKTIKSIKKQLGDENENNTDNEPEKHGRQTKDNTSHRRNVTGDQIEEEEGAKVQGEDEARRLEGELQHFNKDHVSQTKKKKKAIGPNRKEANGEEEERIANPEENERFPSEEEQPLGKTDKRNFKKKNSPPKLDRTETTTDSQRNEANSTKLKSNNDLFTQPSLKSDARRRDDQTRNTRNDLEMSDESNDMKKDSPKLDRSEVAAGSQRNLTNPAKLKSKNNLSAQPSDALRRDDRTKNSRNDLETSDERNDISKDSPKLDRTNVTAGSQRNLTGTTKPKSKNDLSTQDSPKSEPRRRNDSTKLYKNDLTSSSLSVQNPKAETALSNAEINRPTAVATLTGETLREELRRSNAALTRVRAGGSADDLKRSNSSLVLNQKQQTDSNYVTQSVPKSRESIRKEPRETNRTEDVLGNAEERDQQSIAESTIPRSSSQLAIETE